MGGSQPGLQPLDTSEFFKDGAFLPGPALPEAMERHCAVHINSSHVFVGTIFHSIFRIHNSSRYPAICALCTILCL